MDPLSLDNVYKTIEECFNRLELSQSWAIKKVETPEMVVIYRSTADTQQLDEFHYELASEVQTDGEKPFLHEVKMEEDFETLPNHPVKDEHVGKKPICEVEKKENGTVFSDPQTFDKTEFSDEHGNGDFFSQATSITTRKRTLKKCRPKLQPKKKMAKGKRKDPDFKCPLPPKLWSKPAKKKKDDPDFNYDETVLQAINEAIRNKPSGRPLKYPELRTIKPNGDGLYKCPKCDHAVSYQTLTKHYETHIGKKFPCSLCKMVFKTKTSLLYHEDLYHNSHQGEHQCHKCEIRYRFLYR